MDTDGEAKTCGACSVCCEVLAVSMPRYEKPSGCRCKHQSPYGGCTNYIDRPDVCSHFQCAWLTSVMMKDTDRPDKLGVMFQPIHGGDNKSEFAQNCVIAYAVDDDAALLLADARACYSAFWKKGIPVWLSDLSGQKTLVDESGKALTKEGAETYLAKLKLVDTR